MFWKVVSKKFPRIFEAAIRLLGIPVSQFLSERNFSHLSNAQKPQQGQQSGDHLDERLYVKGKDDEGALVTVLNVGDLGK